jgi:hypothetical protein
MEQKNLNKICLFNFLLLHLQYKPKIKPKMRKTEKGVSRVEARIETITVDRAKELLSKNVDNRRVDESRVTRLAQTIINGDFVITNQGIGVDKNGIVSDGQHRLKAIIKANLPVDMLIITGLEPKCRYVIDTGKGRSHADALQISKLALDTNSKGKAIDYSKVIASASAYIMLHQTNRFNSITAYGKLITSSELVSFVEKNHDELLSSAKEVKKLTDDCKYVQVPHMMFLYQMHKFFNKSRIVKFINIVTGKENAENPETCPATKLRNTFIENYGKRRGTKLGTKDLMGLAIDASNKFMARVEMGAKNKKLMSRPTKSGIVNIKFTGNLNDEGQTFFKSIKTDSPLPEDEKSKERKKLEAEIAALEDFVAKHK